MKGALFNLVESARSRLAVTKSVAVLTGAGVSAESGVPTFRGKEGLWKTYRAETLATPEAFRTHPERVWEWYQWRRECIATTYPNPAHEGLRNLEHLLEDRNARFTLITQNVDGLHTVAGSRNVIELHGNIWRMRCTGCGRKTKNRSLSLPPLPECEVCAALYRPDIVWFGEAIAPEDLRRSLDACQTCDMFLVIGTSAVVQPAASFASVAKEAGAFVVEINPVPALSGLSDMTLAGPAAEIVPVLVDFQKKKRF